MELKVRIRKQTGSFSLDIDMESCAQRIGILGASGSGKSMTLRSIAGIERPDSGKIEAGGRVLFDSAAGIDLKPQKRNVGYMFQNYALFPTMTVLKNLECGIHTGSCAEKREKAMAMLTRMKLDGLENRLPGELSGGQQQRTALARILLSEPGVILLDEPFSALDSDLVGHMEREMMEMLTDFRGQIVMVSHNRAELSGFSEEVFVIKEGRVVCHDDAAHYFRA